MKWLKGSLLKKKKMKYETMVVNQEAFEMGVPFSTASLYANC